MQLQNIIIALAVTTVLSQACIKQVDVKTRNVKPVLVVEGSITTDTIPYTVKLTYSGAITSSEGIPDQYLEKEAIVSISDDEGNLTSLSYKNQGIYETTDPAYIGKPGRTYSVTVVLKDGRKYISTPEKITAAVPITGINVTFINKFNFDVPTYMNVSVDAADPAQEENYYRWTFNSWVERRALGVGCGFGCVLYEYCYQNYIDKEVHIMTDESINGNQIKNQTVGRCYIYAYGNPYIDIGQISLSREAYQFWKNYNDQLTRTGGILDPLPATIRGNIYNMADPNDFALGYFSASSVYHRKAMLIPYSITDYLLQISANQFIPQSSGACFDVFPDTRAYPPPPALQNPPPPGWENAEEIKVYW